MWNQRVYPEMGVTDTRLIIHQLTLALAYLTRLYGEIGCPTRLRYPDDVILDLERSGWAYVDYQSMNLRGDAVDEAQHIVERLLEGRALPRFRPAALSRDDRLFYWQVSANSAQEMLTDLGWKPEKEAIGHKPEWHRHTFGVIATGAHVARCVANIRLTNRVYVVGRDSALPVIWLDGLPHVDAPDSVLAQYAAQALAMAELKPELVASEEAREAAVSGPRNKVWPVKQYARMPIPMPPDIDLYLKIVTGMIGYAVYGSRKGHRLHQRCFWPNGGELYSANRIDAAFLHHRIMRNAYYSSLPLGLAENEAEAVLVVDVASRATWVCNRRWFDTDPWRRYRQLTRKARSERWAPASYRPTL